MPRWIQHPITHKLIPAEEYVRPKERTHMIMPDIEPFKSNIDGSVISSRPQLEAHNRRHNVTGASDYPPEWVAKRGKQILREQERRNKQERIEFLGRAIDEHSRG